MVKHISDYSKQEIKDLINFIKQVSKTPDIEDIVIVGSILFPKEYFYKFRTPSSDIDIVVITKDSIPSQVEFWNGVKINLMYSEVVRKWYGYDMPRYYLLSNKLYYPDDDYGMFWQIARKKLFYDFPFNNSTKSLDIKNKTFVCSLCGKEYDWLEINAYKTLNKVKNEYSVLYLCDNCDKQLFKE